MNFNGVRDAMQSGDGRRVTLMRKMGDTHQPAALHKERVGPRPPVATSSSSPRSPRFLGGASLMNRALGRKTSTKISPEELQEMEDEADRLKTLLKRKTMMTAGFRINGRVSGLKVVANPIVDVAPEENAKHSWFEWIDERVGVINPMGNFRLTWDMCTSPAWVHVQTCLGSTRGPRRARPVDRLERPETTSERETGRGSAVESSRAPPLLRL